MAPLEVYVLNVVESLARNKRSPTNHVCHSLNYSVVNQYVSLLTRLIIKLDVKMTELANSSADEDDFGSSQFAELLKPIRELTKANCWGLNLADKLNEYIDYIKDVHIEVQVNGQRMKLDFAKAAMVVQSSGNVGCNIFD